MLFGQRKSSPRYLDELGGGPPELLPEMISVSLPFNQCTHCLTVREGCASTSVGIGLTYLQRFFSFCKMQSLNSFKSTSFDQNCEEVFCEELL